jgi:THO complex subunit 1
MLELLKDSKSTTKSIGDAWKIILDLCFHLIHFSSGNKKEDFRYSDMEPRKMPLVLMEDCLDGLTLSECKLFWTKYVEPSLDVILGDLFWKTSKICHLQFLRVCNQFLSRAASNLEWKGRIMMALARAFSMADRSALKMWGHFHNANQNDFETQQEFDEASANGSNKSAEYSLYRAFWSLQTDFSNPNSIQVAEFINKMKTVLNALESASTSKEKGKKSVPTSTSCRYLTSSTLFLTQLDTLEFRSSVISQFLIIASHFSAESPSLGNALSNLMLRARKLLQTDNPQLYTILWDSILSNKEVQWRQWKKETKCTASVFAPKRKLNDDEAKPKKRSRLLVAPLGAADAAEQYQVLEKDELVKISQNLGETAPYLEAHLQDYVDALDPEAGIEDEYHPKNDSLFTWRAMRLYARHQLPFLKMCRKPEDLERMTRQWYKDKGTDIPGEMPQSDKDSDEESIRSSGSSNNSAVDKKEESDDEDDVNIDEMSAVENDDDEKPGEQKDSEMKDVEDIELTKDLVIEDQNKDEDKSDQVASQMGNEKEPLSSTIKEEKEASVGNGANSPNYSTKDKKQVKNNDAEMDKEELKSNDGTSANSSMKLEKTSNDEEAEKDFGSASVKSESIVKSDADSIPIVPVTDIVPSDNDKKKEADTDISTKKEEIAKALDLNGNEENKKSDSNGRRSNSRDRGRSLNSSRENDNGNHKRDMSSIRGRVDEQKQGRRDEHSRGPRGGDGRGPRNGGSSDRHDGPRGGGLRDENRRGNRQAVNKGGRSSRDGPRGGGDNRGGRPERDGLRGSGDNRGLPDRDGPRGGGEYRGGRSDRDGPRGSGDNRGRPDRDGPRGGGDNRGGRSDRDGPRGSEGINGGVSRGGRGRRGGSPPGSRGGSRGGDRRSRNNKR